MPFVTKPGIDLTTPQATFASQLKFIEQNKLEDFVETFTPPARMHLNAEVFAKCQESVKAAPVKPDWDHAVLGMKNMHQVTKVHIGDGEPVGFHRMAPTSWVADTIWCARSEMPSQPAPQPGAAPQPGQPPAPQPGQPPAAQAPPQTP